MIRRTSPTIKAAFITATAIIFGAIIEVGSCKTKERKLHFQGTVVNSNGAGVPNVSLYVVGGREDYTTESNGNFDITFADSISSFRLRIDPQKGYKFFSKSYDLPRSGVEIVLEKEQ
jgi:hypothetical protein